MDEKKQNSAVLLPVITIVGKPNVGKSTLFNRLTKTRNALVGEMPGLTRDRQYGIADINIATDTIFVSKDSTADATPPIAPAANVRTVIVIDTGGFAEEEGGLANAITKQSFKAMQEATVIIFMVDGKSGLTTTDQLIAEQIRKLNKPIYLVVNKTEGVPEKLALTQFYELGFSQMFAISAEHGANVAAMLAAIGKSLPHIFPEQSAISDSAEKSVAIATSEVAAVRIAFVGRPNVGKSTLVNRILGEERVIVYDEPGTTRDSILVNFNRRGKDYILIDTAGIRRRGKVTEVFEKFSVIKALQAIESAHVVVLLLDAQENITEQDLRLLGLVLDAGRALVIAVNKWDGISSLQRDTIRSELERRLRFIDYAKIYFISALHGTGVGNLFTAIDRAHKSATQEIKTAQLTRILQAAVSNYPPPLVKGKSVKLRYAHLGGRNPPLIVIYGNRIESVSASYTKYLEHYFREHLALVGTPIRIVFRGKNAD